MIARCKCVHKDQDALHGKGMRVFNTGPKGKTGGRQARCTVCGEKIPCSDDAK